MNIAIVILNYNMHVVTDQWLKYLIETVKFPHKVIIIDNGSDEFYCGGSTDDMEVIRVSKNLRTTGGVLLGMYRAAMHKCTHVWTISTSTLPPEKPWNYDPLYRLQQAFTDETIMGVAPTFIGESKSWPHQLLMSDGTNSVEDHWLLGLFSMWDLSWAMSTIDPNITWSWGVDIEMSHLTRISQARMLKHNGVPMRLREGIAYKEGKMHCTQFEREMYAREEMETILTSKWGKDWKHILIPFDEYIEKM